MKLSEAIREGAKKRPQCRLFYGRKQYDNYGPLFSCALGAAYEGLTGMLPGDSDADDEAISERLRQAFPELLNLMPTDAGQSRLSSIIAIRNDAGETRESIADWLESEGL